MGTALKLETDQTEKGKAKSTKAKIETTYTDELIIGICSPIGSERDSVVNAIKKILSEKYHYSVIVIKLSDFILEYYNVPHQPREGKTAAYTNLFRKIEGGDHLRKEYNNNSILVELAIQKIREDREKVDTIDIEGRRVCYIIDSIKNLEELQLLRAVYRDIFYLFSIFSSEKERINALTQKGLSYPEANSLIDSDEHENNDYGQNVRDTFIDGDFFVRSSSNIHDTIENKIHRYFHLIFNSEIITPSFQETAMYFAKSAAGNSSCLSRQVGATITDKNGIVISQGWNDVPKKGGNLYRNSDSNPKRCFELGYCTNSNHKEDIFEEIINKIKEEITIANKIQKGPFSITTNDETYDNIEKIIRTSRFKNIIEYSRSIHAEMHAIIIGSQLTGEKMIDGDLFCTTYPCHNCARHIILAGIKNIYYIEPYKKSLCLSFHSDAITEDESDTSKVRILLYDGVAPRRYLDFFATNNDDRKDDDGKVKKIDFKTSSPKNRLSLQAIPDLENQAIHALKACGFLKVESYE